MKLQHEREMYFMKINSSNNIATTITSTEAPVHRVLRSRDIFRVRSPGVLLVCLLTLAIASSLAVCVCGEWCKWHVLVTFTIVRFVCPHKSTSTQFAQSIAYNTKDPHTISFFCYVLFFSLPFLPAGFSI